MTRDRLIGGIIAASMAGLTAWQASSGNWIVAAVAVLGVFGGLYPVALLAKGDK